MATLLQIRDTIALHGRMELQQLCGKVNDTPAMVQAMLLRLEQMGWVTKINIEEQDNPCEQGGCQACISKKKCITVIYQIHG